MASGAFLLSRTMSFFPVCYMMLKGLLKNIDPSSKRRHRDMGASWYLPALHFSYLPGLATLFSVSFIESIADFANPMIIGGSYDTLATTIYLRD